MTTVMTLSIWLCVVYGAIVVFAWSVGRFTSVMATRRESARLTLERLHDIRRHQ